MPPRALTALAVIVLCAFAPCIPGYCLVVQSSASGDVGDGGRFLPDTAVLASVGARTTRVRDFVDAYFNSYIEVRPSPDSLGRVEFLNSMIRKEILGLSVLSLNLPLTFEERTQLRQHRERVLSNALYQRVVLDSVIVTEDELRDLYSQFRYEQRFRHILLPDRSTAERVRQLLLDGKLDWSQARRQHGIGIETADREGDLGWIPRGALDPDLAVSLYALQRGQISEVIEDREGFHVVQVVERRGADPQAYSAMRSIIRMELERRKAAALAERMRAQLTASIEMRYDSTNIRWAASHFDMEPLVRQTARGLKLSPSHVPHFEPDDLNRVLARHREGEYALGEFLSAYGATSLVLRPKVGAFEAFRAQLDTYVLEPYLARLAEQRGLERDSWSVALIEKRREELLVERFYRDSIMSQVKVSREESRAYYEAHPADYHTYAKVRFAAIVRAYRAAADSLRARLAAGERAEAILRADSLAGHASGSIQERRQDQHGPNHELLFEELRPGQVRMLGPDAEGDWLILQVLEHDPGRQLSFEEAEGYAEESVRNLKAEERLKATLTRLSQRYRIRSRPELVMRVRLEDPTLD